MFWIIILILSFIFKLRHLTTNSSSMNKRLSKAINYFSVWVGIINFTIFLSDNYIFRPHFIFLMCMVHRLQLKYCKFDSLSEESNRIWWRIAHNGDKKQNRKISKIKFSYLYCYRLFTKTVPLNKYLRMKQLSEKCIRWIVFNYWHKNEIQTKQVLTFIHVKNHLVCISYLTIILF